MLRLLLTYVSISSFKIGYVSTMVEVCFGFPNQNGQILTVHNLCFDFLDLSTDCARPVFWLFWPKWAIFDCARPMFRLFRFFLIKIWYVWTMVEVCFGFPDQNGHILTVLNLYFDDVWLRFYFFSQLGMIRLCWKYVSTFLIKVGHLRQCSICFDYGWSMFRFS